MNFGHLNVVNKPDRLRILGIVAGLLISIPLFGSFYLSGNSFFARASDEHPRDVLVTSVGKSEATIAWTTDRNTQAVIEYGSSPTELISFAPEAESKKDHQVEMTFLAPSTTYYFVIRIGNEVYDNGGVPWTFTTSSLSGEDPLKQVKGITTRLTGIPDDSIKDSTMSATLTKPCTELTCDEVKTYLGRGCSARDYVQCLANPRTATGSSAVQSISYTPVPLPTSVQIISNVCTMEYIQPLGNNCAIWTWDNLDTKAFACRESFDRYVLQCRNKSFDGSSNNNDPMIWYYSGTLDNIASNTAPLNQNPSAGTTVYCQIRAEDEYGGDNHATKWIRAEKKCE
jgi:hypothetical protein